MWPTERTRLMRAQLRIAAVTHQFPTDSQPHRGLAMHRLFSALSSIADVEVFCVTPQYPSEHPILQPRTFDHKPATTLGGDPKLEGTIVPYPVLPYLTRPINGFLCASRLGPALKAACPDIVYASFLYPDAFAAVRCGRTLGVPVIAEAIGSDLRLLRGYWHRRHTRATLLQADRVVTVSDELNCCAVALGAPKSRVQTIRRGVDDRIFRPADRSQARSRLSVDQESELVVFVGRLVSVKGLPDLLHAFSLLSARRPRLQLVCIGDGPLRPQLDALAHELSLGPRIRFAGSLAAQGVADWLAASDLLCLPSHSEGLPNCLVEALAAGRPVVATNVGGIPEILDASCGRMVPPRDPEALAEALQEVLSRPWNAETVAARHRRSWSVCAADVLALCREVVSERSALLNPRS